MKGKLGLVLMGGALLIKSLIQFSVDGGSYVPSSLFTWGQTMVEVIKIMMTSFKRSHAGTAILSAPNPAAGHHQPMPLPRFLDLHRQVWVSLLWGHGSFLLWVLVHTLFCLCPPKVHFPSPV